jgi:hypothetical protein
MCRRHQADTIAIGIDHGAWFLDALSRNNQFAVAARCCGRKRLRVMVEFYDRAQRIVPVLFLPAANRQYVVEAKAGILLPEPQHRLQIVRRKSEVDDVLCELHLSCRQLKDVSASFSETSQSLAALAVSRAWGVIRAGAGAPRNSPIPPGP